MDVARRVNAALRPVPGWVAYGLGALPLCWLVVRGFTGDLGANPVKELEHTLGLHGLQFLLATLAVTPLRRLTGISLIRWRRAMGLTAFAYIVLHLAVWLFLDMQLRWPEIARDLTRRLYIIIGMAGLAMMLPLALTSNDAAIRAMGAAAWRRLHRLAWPAALAGGVHFLMVVKSWPPEPIVYLAILAVILGLRLARFGPRRG